MSLEYIVEICVAIDIAILGIAYPIIVDKISNIGDKYGSQYLSNLFDNEFPQLPIRVKINRRLYQISIFKLTLYLTIFTFFFLIFNVKPQFGWNNFLLNNSAKLFVLAFTFLLTVFFFIWLDKVVLYNGKSTSILKRIISQYNRISNKNDLKSYRLKTINELTFYSIENKMSIFRKRYSNFTTESFPPFAKNMTRQSHWFIL